MTAGNRLETKGGNLQADMLSASEHFRPGSTNSAQQGAAPAQECGGCGLGGCAFCDTAWRSHREEQARRATDEELTDLRKLADGAAPLGWNARLNVIPAVVDELTERRSAAPTPEYVSGWLARGKEDEAILQGDIDVSGVDLKKHTGCGCKDCAFVLRLYGYISRIRALAPPSAPPVQQIERPTDTNGVWIPPDLYKTACALDALIHSTPDMSGDLRDVRLTGGHKKISDAVRAFKWALTEPPAPSVNEDRMLLLKALLTDKAALDAGRIFVPDGTGHLLGYPLPSLEKPLTDDLRAALIKATEAK